MWIEVKLFKKIFLKHFTEKRNYVCILLQRDTSLTKLLKKFSVDLLYLCTLFYIYVHKFITLGSKCCLPA